MKRLVEKVVLKSRPDLTLYVRALDFNEDADLRAIRKALDGETEDGQKQMAYAWIAAYMCDEQGERVCATTEDAAKFISDNRLQSGACWKIITTAQDFNALNDEAVEEERKN